MKLQVQEETNKFSTVVSLLRLTFLVAISTASLTSTSPLFSYLLPWTKKRTILEIRGEKNAVPRVISCSIRRDQRRAKVADSRGSDFPALIAPDRA